MKTNENNKRSTSNTSESQRLKKSLSTNNPLKNSLTNLPNPMESSLKPNRINPRSNKKSLLQSTQSTKSLGCSSHTLSQQHLQPLKKVHQQNNRMQASDGQNKKISSIAFKALKNKAIGQCQKQGQQTYKNQSRQTEEKENQPIPLSHLPCIPQQQQRSQRQLTNQSFNYIPNPVNSAPNLNNFEIGRKLGKGRFGDVFIARDRQSGMVLGIKMINKAEVRQAGMQNQVIQQIKIQLYCKHPNILKLYGYFSDKDKIYLLLQLATHGCLFRQIRRKSCLPQNESSFYFRQISAAVRYLHSLFVIHRDIKPQNILNNFNVLKLCDFGWAAYSPLQYIVSLYSQRQTFCGTLDYVPPEIVTGQFYDERVDVWCLGVLCYELCTGKAPFQSKVDEKETYNKILKAEIEFPIYLSGQVVDLVGKILTRDPNQRMDLEQVESHEWMRRYQNEAGRMISKEIWDQWSQLTRN